MGRGNRRLGHLDRCVLAVSVEPPHLFIGLCRALWLTPLVITATVMAGHAGLLDEPPAPREPEKRPDEPPKMRVVGGLDV